MNNPGFQQQFRFLLLLAILSVIGGCTSKPPVEGTYLRQGVSSYIVIERGANWKLQVHAFRYGGPDQWEVSSRGRNLRLTFKSPWDNIYEVIDLAASKTIPGDWDLVGYSINMKDPKKAPPRRTVPSYLHRVDDPRIHDYFEAVHEDSPESPTDPKLYKELASGLVKSLPDDPYIRMFYIDMLIRNKDLEELERSYHDWKAEHPIPSDPIFYRFSNIVEWNIESLQLSKEGKNGYDYYAALLNPKINLDTRIKGFPDLLTYEKSARPCYPVGFEGIPNFLDTQTTAKVLQAEAIFQLIHGDQDQALSTVSSVYWFGQLMNDEASYIGRLIGIAIRGISSRGLSIYTLNACQDEQDYLALWEMLEKLENHQVEVLEEDLLQFDLYNSINTEEYYTRHHAADARFENVRMAAAAKYHLLKEGQFPQNSTEFTSFLKEGLPEDPFVPEQPMRFITSPDRMICYSVGPDRQNNRAKIEYDPTNGTISDGDISLKVPRERQFPFPKGGIKASTVEEFMEYFPNGLPIDVFGPKRPSPQPLRVSNTTPLYIYSLGPDLTENTGKILSRFTPQFHYDPTNGTISNGDLFSRIEE